MLTLVAFQTLQSSALIDTNHQLSDLQFSQIMSFLSDVPFADPMQSYRYHHFMRARRTSRNQRLTGDMLWYTPKVQRWLSTGQSAIVILKGNFRSRLAIRDFCIGTVDKLRSADIPVIWALSAASPNSTGQKRTSIDLLKYMTFQAISVNQKLRNEKSMALSCRQCHSASTEKEWFQLFQQVLVGNNSRVYLLLDMGLIDDAFGSPESFSWLSAFLESFQTISDRGLNMTIKVLLLTYNLDTSSQLPNDLISQFVVPAKNIASGPKKKSVVRPGRSLPVR